ncbi:lipo-like protein [Vibrio galatheae]|uniref:Lipo-like protein n=1 Tax=Vibrio galatheae TaxID=579748 RepID=A0A0F4NK95_9VIBR|nr:YbaY family lipoprotein [Vibrio galatheae]KJY83502.1 lipo-like protein [Vibrio galatheae]
MKKGVVFSALALIGLLLVGCQSAPPTHTQNQVETISGTLVYRERIALPPDAMVTVVLQDVSLADAPAKVIAKHKFETNGAQVPLAFDLAYRTDKINPRHRYSVSARIEIGGQLHFITDTSYPVITDSESTDKINLRLVGVN